MRPRLPFSRLPLVAGLMAFPALAHAHPGHEGHDITWDFTGGALHPLFGLDHLLAIVTVGIWAAQFTPGRRWILPAAFVAAMAAGGVSGALGVAVPLLEVLIAGSVLLLGLCLLQTQPARMSFAAPVVGMFGLFHGFAHGLEVPPTSVAWAYGLGFITMSGLLHAAGVLLGLGLARFSTRWRHAVAVAVSGAGAWLLAS